MGEPFYPDLQMAFAVRLDEIDEAQLAPALGRTVAQVGIAALDEELSHFVDSDALGTLARRGLRGEVFFAVPSLLRVEPRLLGYYRLLYGLSQKEFSRTAARFLTMETEGRLSPATSALLDGLIERMSETGRRLLENLPEVSLQRIRDLQLLTLGPQLRGSRLNELGAAATRLVFNRIRHAIPDEAVLSQTESEITLENAAGRRVTVRFGSDPDIAITEELGSTIRQTLSVEIKGGTDVSNAHNRLGEAEKSHQKARSKGFGEFWTIVNSVVPESVARTESPTTNRFFQLEEITDTSHAEWQRFREELASRLGLRAGPR